MYTGKRPEFLDHCVCDGNNMEEVCETCEHKVECEEYMQPIVAALERELGG